MTEETVLPTQTSWTTVGGYNPAPIEVGSLSHYSQGLIRTPNGVCYGFLNHQQYYKGNPSKSPIASKFGPSKNGEKSPLLNLRFSPLWKGKSSEPNLRLWGSNPHFLGGV